MLFERKVHSPNYFERIPSQEGKHKLCTGARAVLLIYNSDHNKLLLAKKSKWPQGWSLIAEHIELGKTPYEEAEKGLRQETGLMLSDLSSLQQIGSEPFVTLDTCRRKGITHKTIIFEGLATTEIVRPNDEAEMLRWTPLEELDMLVQKTRAYQKGLLSEQDYILIPGLIPASIQVLWQRGLVNVV